MADLQRKTANLLDYKVLFSNSFVKETASFKYYRITVTANTQYTLKSNAPASVENAVTTFLYGRSDTMSTANDGLYTDVAKTITSTDDGYVYIAVRKAGTSTAIPSVSETDFDNGTYTIMLNEGSTAKPYEPYGWVHSLRKLTTATETIQSGDTIYANGQPITTYNIKGNEEHTGTPSPQNPVMPQGTGNKTANLLDLASWTNQNTDTRSYFQIVVLFMNDNTQLGKTSNIDIRTTGEKTIAINITEANCNRMQIKHNGSSRDLFIGNAYGEFYGEYTLSFNCISNDPTTVGGIELQNIMLNSGSTALPYEPYGQYKIPISSGSVTTPMYLTEPLMKIGDTVDSLASIGTATYNIYKLVLTGNEQGWTKSGTYQGSFFAQVLTNINSAANDYPARYAICSHAPLVALGNFASGTVSITGTTNNKSANIWFGAPEWTVDDFKAFLAQEYANGTPVTIYYILATPTTETVTAPSIPTTEGANSITVDTTVQPSEFTATWTGWHDASVKEKSENLFDKAQTSLIYNAYLTSDGTWLWDGSSRTVKLLCDGNTQYTISIGVTSPIFRISEYNDSTITPSSSASSSAILNSIVRGENMDEYTFTTAADTKCLIFQASYAIYDSWINSLMFNEGQTALPYEPYWK